VNTTADLISVQVGSDAHPQVPSVRRAVGRAHLLEGPIAAQMVRLAWPVLVVLALQTFVGVVETYFVSVLGSDAVAGVALVFPIFMLMTMMSNGGIGGGVSSAVARAIGAGRVRDAEALGHGKDYVYPHEHEGHYTPQQYLPKRLLGTYFYQPSDEGYEVQVTARLEMWREAQRKALGIERREDVPELSQEAIDNLKRNIR